MSVDFVARALAQQSGQGGQSSFTTLATGIPGVQIPSTVKVMQTSGYAAHGIGGGTYVSDGLATASLATAHPRFCKADGSGRYWRLLPDDNGLIPVACGGANGNANPLTLIRTSGLAAFSASPWSTYQSTLSSTIAGPSGTTGNAVTLTATGSPANLFVSPCPHVQVKARIKGGTAPFIALFSNLIAGGPPVYG